MSKIAYQNQVQKHADYSWDGLMVMGKIHKKSAHKIGVGSKCIVVVIVGIFVVGWVPHATYE